MRSITETSYKIFTMKSSTITAIGLLSLSLLYPAHEGQQHPVKSADQKPGIFTTAHGLSFDKEGNLYCPRLERHRTHQQNEAA